MRQSKNEAESYELLNMKVDITFVVLEDRVV